MNFTNNNNDYCCRWKVTGMTHCSLTVCPLCLAGSHFGMSLHTRMASSSRALLASFSIWAFFSASGSVCPFCAVTVTSAFGGVLA